MPTFKSDKVAHDASGQHVQHQDASTKDYYKQRAAEYEEIYRRLDPIRKSEQNALAVAMIAALSGRRVLELACGTGYWTEKLSEFADSILATDTLDEMLQIAGNKFYPKSNVQFKKMDAFHVTVPYQTYDGGLCNFLFSHAPRLKLTDFIQGFHHALKPGATVFMADNVFIPDIGGTLINRPGGDTFKVRKLANGEMFEVLKNYYSESELRAVLGFKIRHLAIHMGQCFWWATYQLG